MNLSPEDRVRIRTEEEYRYKVFTDLNKPTKHSLWERANSPIMIWFLGSVVLGIISFGYAKHSVYRNKISEVRAISNGVLIRLSPAKKAIHESLKSGRITEQQLKPISNLFTGKVRVVPDEFGQIGVPGLLFKHGAVTGDRNSSNLAVKYVNLMVLLEKEKAFDQDAARFSVYNYKLSKEGRTLLERLLFIIADSEKFVSRSII